MSPEKISLTDPGDNSDSTRPGRVSNIVYLGNQAAYTVDMGDGIELVAQARPREDGKLPYAINDPLAVGFSSRALRVLVQ